MSAKRFKQAIAIWTIYLPLTVGMISSPLLLGTGCVRKKEIPKVGGTIIKEDLKTYDSAWKHDTYRILVDCGDGKKRMYTYTGRAACDADFKYNVGDKVNLPTETHLNSEYPYVKIVE